LAAVLGGESQTKRAATLMAKRACLRPGCAALVAKGYCATHQTAAEIYDRARGSAAKRGYGGAWDKVRRQTLARDGFLCQPCKRAGRIVAATEVDHVTELADGGARLALGNLLAVCHGCHVRKTWKARKARTGGG
jgi:5-methylcytosine-specific restriction protein A